MSHVLVFFIYVSDHIISKSSTAQHAVLKAYLHDFADTDPTHTLSL